MSPCYDPLSHLAYVAGREHVSHVWVDGELVVQDGVLAHLDEPELVAKATYWQEKIRSRDGRT
ncbi:N-ethylammeline chlorohydrolase [compost metagenome]